jgi:hypothetical protein
VPPAAVGGYDRALKCRTIDGETRVAGAPPTRDGWR